MKSTGKSHANLRGLSQLTVFLVVCMWQTFPALIGMLLFILLVRVLRIDWRWLAGIGGITIVTAVLSLALTHQLASYISDGWQINMRWWHLGEEYGWGKFRS